MTQYVLLLEALFRKYPLLSPRTGNPHSPPPSPQGSSGPQVGVVHKDEAFIAIGYAHYAQERAMQELRHPFESQWENGLLPQIVYDPHFSRYFPGINFWCIGGNSRYPCDRKTSGVIQPPVHTTAVLRIYQDARDLASARDFLQYAFPHLKAWHEYLYRE